MGAAVMVGFADVFEFRGVRKSIQSNILVLWKILQLLLFREHYS